MGDIEVKSYDNVSQVAVGGCSKHSTITNLVGNNPMIQRRFAAYTLMLYCGEVMYPTRCAQSDLLVRGSYTNVILWRTDRTDKTDRTVIILSLLLSSLLLQNGQNSYYYYYYYH